MARFSNTLGALSFIYKKSKAQWYVLDVVQIRKLLSQMAFQSAFQATIELKVCGPLLYQTRIMRGYVYENLLPEIRALLDPSKFATLFTRHLIYLSGWLDCKISRLRSRTSEPSQYSPFTVYTYNARVKGTKIIVLTLIVLPHMRSSKSPRSTRTILIATDNSFYKFSPAIACCN